MPTKIRRVVRKRKREDNEGKHSVETVAPLAPARLNRHIVITGTGRGEVLRAVVAQAGARLQGESVAHITVVGNGTLTEDEVEAVEAIEHSRDLLAKRGVVLRTQHSPLCFCCIGRDALQATLRKTEHPAGELSTTIYLTSQVVDIDALLASTPWTPEETLLLHCTSQKRLTQNLWCGANVAQWCPKGVQCDDPSLDDVRLHGLITNEQIVSSHVICYEPEPLRQRISVDAAELLSTLNPSALLVAYGKDKGKGDGEGALLTDEAAAVTLPVDVTAYSPSLPYPVLRVASGIAKELAEKNAKGAKKLSFCYTKGGGGGGSCGSACGGGGGCGGSFDTRKLFDLLCAEDSPLNGFGCVFHAEGTLFLKEDPHYAYTVTSSGGAWDVSRAFKTPSSAMRTTEFAVFLTPFKTASGSAVAPRCSSEAISDLFDACLARDNHTTDTTADTIPHDTLKILKGWGFKLRKPQDNDDDDDDDDDEEEEEEEDEEDEEEESEDEASIASSASSFYEEHTVRTEHIGDAFTVAVGTADTPYPTTLSSGKKRRRTIDLQQWWVDAQEARDLPASVQEWYKRGRAYWAGLKPDLRGVELDELHWFDVKESRAIFEAHHAALPTHEAQRTRRALDLAGGIGRFVKGVLADFYDYVHLVEGTQLLADSARLVLSPERYVYRRLSDSDVTAMQLQDISVAELCEGGKYDCIVLTWVLMFITDSDVVRLLKKVKAMLKEGGFVYCKENTLDGEEVFAVNCENSSTNRSKPHYQALFEAAGLRVSTSWGMNHVPSHGNLHTVTAFMLKV